MSVLPDSADSAWVVPERYALAEIPIEELDHHPDNVREDYKITSAFCQSVKTELQVALSVVPIPDDYVRPEGHEHHRYWVVKGNRRLAGARQVGLTHLLCVIDMNRAGDRAGQFMDMVTENEQREGLTIFERARALFQAHEAGASRTRIRKSTGLSREDVSASVKAGALSAQTKDAALAMHYEWTLTDLAILAEFDGDEEALAEIRKRVSWGQSVEYAAGYIRTEREEAAEHARLRGELESAGVAVTDALPAGAMTLRRLSLEIGGELTAETHATCDGHGVYFFSPLQATFYCTTPDQHGYAPPEPRSDIATDTTTAVTTTATGTAGSGSGSERKIVIEGNRAWKACAVVRHEWLTGLLARKTAPKQVLKFVTGQLLTMPEPLCKDLGGARRSTLFTKLAAAPDPQCVETATAARLPLLQLAPIAVAYERQLTEAGESAATWRIDRWSPCTRADAAVWLSFLVELGYTPSPIERSVIDGVPYLGDAPIEQDEPQEPDDSESLDEGPDTAIGEFREAEPSPAPLEADPDRESVHSDEHTDDEADRLRVHHAAEIEQEVADRPGVYDSAEIEQEVADSPGVYDSVEIEQNEADRPGAHHAAEIEQDVADRPGVHDSVEIERNEDARTDIRHSAEIERQQEEDAAA